MADVNQKKARKFVEGRWLYDSDEDLTDKERKEIAESRNPQKTREEIWEEKGTWDKTKKMLKGAWYGDKRKKNQNK